MATPQPIRIMSKPGIKRDGTLLEGDEYKDGLWCRFSRRGLPRKIAGYKAITSYLPEIVRGMDSYFFGGVNYIHVGSQSFIQQQLSDILGNPGSLYDRTPVGFTPNPNNLWQFDTLYNSATGSTTIVAHPGQNLNDITNPVETPIYYGSVSANTQLTPTGMSNVSGGVASISPYLFGLSNYGRLDVSPINDIGTGITVNSAYISDQKLLKCLPLRNGGGGPAALIWSLSDLIIVTFNPAILSGIPFNFNTLSSEISILAPAAVVEFDGIYYWPEVDHFSMFNGIVRELPNNLNINFFFKNLNFAQRQKVFAVKVQAHGEIWWCFPYGSSTECNWAVIYNVNLNTWYDTPLPDMGRSSGADPRTFNKPYMTDTTLTPTGYTLWQHETGLDKTIGGQSYPIRSYFKTTEISPILNGKDKALRVAITEPDLGQTGDMTCTLFARANAREQQVAADTSTIKGTVSGPDDEVMRTKVNARLLAFQFESNTPGGDYYLGNTIAHVEETDGRITS